jgi:hypothetical protein
MKKLAFILIGLFLAIPFTYSQSLSGTWIFDTGNFPLTMLLLDDGTGEFQGMPIKYSTNNGNLNIDDGYQPISYTYQLTQTSLTLSGGGLPSPIAFTRPAAESGAVSSTGQNTNQAQNQYNGNNSQQSGSANSIAGTTNKSQPSGSGSSNLIGVWEGQQGKMVFYPEGNLFYNGTSYQYSVYGNTISITANDGSITFNYSISNNQLTVTQNANSATYTKTSVLRQDVVDQQMVGKWCIMSSSYNSYSGGGSSSEECITLNADGTYSYNYSASRESVYGGTSNQDSDLGTWRTDGLTVVSSSQTTGKTTRYSLLKENAQNGDATIVIGGKKFVTAYNRPGW